MKYANVCRMLMYLVQKLGSARVGLLRQVLLLLHADVCRRMLTYADVC